MCFHALQKANSRSQDQSRLTRDGPDATIISTDIQNKVLTLQIKKILNIKPKINKRVRLKILNNDEDKITIMKIIQNTM